MSTLFAEQGLTLSPLAYYVNNLHPDPRERSAVNDHDASDSAA